MLVDSATLARQEYTWEWDRREYLRVFRAVQRKARGGWALRVVGWVLVTAAVLAVAFIIWAFLTGRRTAAWAEVPWALLLVAWLGLFRWWIPRAAARGFRKLHSGPLHLIVDAGGVDSGSEVSHVQMQWRAIQRVLEPPDVFLLFFASRAAFYVPKRAMGGEDGVRAFRALVRAAVGDRAQVTGGALD